MSALGVLLRNRRAIQSILSADPHLLIDKLLEKHVITFREHRELKISGTTEALVMEVLDLIQTKGETTCRRFLELLQTDEDLKAAFPGLQDKLRDYVELKAVEEMGPTVSPDEQLRCGLEGLRLEDQRYSGGRPYTITLQSRRVRAGASHGDSALGSVWQVGDWIRQYWSSVSAQVLLFLSPPAPISQRRRLYVLLLPRSVSVDEVKLYYPDTRHIHVFTTCTLVKNHRYRIECPEACGIQPYEAVLNLNSRSVHPQFEILLPEKVERVNLTLKDQRNRTVWEEEVHLSLSQPLLETLKSVGDEIPVFHSSISLHTGGFTELYQHFSSVRVQVVLFLEKPITQTRRLHVLLLQFGVNPVDVNPFGKRPPHDAVLIQMPGTCELLTRQKYRAGCPEAIMITPKEAVFDQNYGKHYSTKFEILLPAETSQLTLRIQDQENKEVWKDKVTLPETPDYETSRYGPEKWQFFSTDVQAGPSKWEEFTPEAATESRKTLYRFQCPRSGSFHCTQTGLVFVVDQKVTLQYGTVRWDELLLQSAGRTPAGPLFHIECLENAVVQLHLPHCETKPVSENMLSVAHITDDGMSFMDPVEITDTHVVINVPHLSAFGLVWGCLREIYKYIRSVSGQVLLFLTPPRKLEVLLLPINVDVSDVKAFVKEDAPDAVYIKVPSKCKLMVNQSYTVDCPEACRIQPEEEEFDLNFGPNYHTTFEIILPPNTKQMTLAIKDGENQVWWRKVDLPVTAVTIENPQRTQKNTSSKETVSSTPKMKIDLYHILEDLQDSEFDHFKWLLELEKTSIPSHQLKKAQRRDAVDLMFQTYVDPEAVEVTKRILTGINRNDLVQTVGNI